MRATNERAETVRRLERDKADLHAELTKLREAIDKNTKQVFKALNLKPEVWQSFKTDSVPSPVADYIMLLFRTDRGRVLGKVRVKGSSIETPFSTTANKDLPVLVPNVWDPDEQHYIDPTFVEFVVTETIDPTAALTILTKGWIDTLGQEPHL